MFILDQYIELWCVYGKESQEGEQIEVTVQMIAETFFCTERNSKLIIPLKGEKNALLFLPFFHFSFHLIIS
ncbi:hypothetical protein ACT453_48045, partial [Bacillus sp. D-CC]